MKYKTIAWGLVLAVGLTLSASAANDSLISLSWLKTNLTQWASGLLEEQIDGMEKVVLKSADKAISKMSSGDSLTDAQIDELARQAAARMGNTGNTAVTLTRGQRVTGPLGAGVILESGTASVNSFTGNDLIDATAGSAAAPGSVAAVGHYYILGIDNGCGITITSDRASVRLLDGAAAQDGYKIQYESTALELQAMGIFRGSDKGFELDRAPTRQEALIMLLRLLGEEDEALAWTAPSPFTDLTGWGEGQRYVSYGAHMGYTSGVTATTFNQYGAASRHVYLTYVLRALGYDDKAGDFVWNTTSDELAVEIGLLTQKQLEQMEKSGFYRDHVALISKNALLTRLKGDSSTLGEQLAMNGVIGWEEYDSLRK